MGNVQPRHLTDTEVAALLTAARTRRHQNAKRDHLLFAVLLNTGMRPGEALALRACDFTLSDHSASVRVRRLKKRRDDGVIDDIPISRALGRVVRRYLRAHEIEAGGRVFPMNLRNAQSLFHRYAELGRIARPVHLYMLRHTAGTRTYRASKDVLMVKAQLGHASARTSEIYVHATDEDRRSVCESAGSEV